MNPLVDAVTLATSVVRPTIIDVRWRLGGPPARDDYARGHIPGAVFVEFETDLCGPAGPAGRHPLPAVDNLQAALRRAGVRTGYPVVVYDYGDGLPAARTWWTLRWAGHARVSVLDGGYPAWVAGGHPVSTDVPTPAAGDITVRPGGMPVLDADGAAKLAREGVLIDARAAPRYRGEVEPIDPVAGHIPGAVNGLVTPPEGVPVGAYCGSGVTAARTILDLHVAGRTDAALYVGSWSNWVADPSRPVATS